MRNWNEKGDVHFDQSTNENIVDKSLCFSHRRRGWVLPLKIPMTIKERLTTEDWDQAIIVAKRTHDRQFVRLIERGCFEFRAMEMALRMAMVKDVCMHLHNCFLMSQHKKGDMVWAVPETMESVGSKPEEDAKHLRELQ
jgi:hypothetical protein